MAFFTSDLGRRVVGLEIDARRAFLDEAQEDAARVAAETRAADRDPKVALLDRFIAAGDLVNIDVSAELNGFYGDTGASFAVPPVTAKIERLCRDGRRAMWSGIRAVRPGGKLNEIGKAIETFADKHGYSLVKNLASHGVGRSLHDDPGEIPTWWEPGDRRRIHEGLVFTIEPFLSLGADWVEELDDGWTLTPPGGEPTVQYEHTLVATKRGPVILTLA